MNSIHGYVWIKYQMLIQTAISRRVFGILGRGWNTKNRVREEWTDTRLSIKCGEIGHNGLRSVVLNFPTFDRQSSICSLFPHPFISVPPTPQVSEYTAWICQILFIDRNKSFRVSTKIYLSSTYYLYMSMSYE